MAARLQTIDTVSPSGAGLSGDTIPRPLTGWRRLAGDWVVVSAATAVCHALGAVTSLLFRMLLNPAQMGVWHALKLLISYGNYANLGISKGAVREFTVALGRRDTEEAERGLSLAFTVNTLTSLLYGAVLLGAGIWIGWHADGPWSGPWSGVWATGLAVVGVMAVVSRWTTFHITILRAKQAFTTTSQVAVLEGVLTLVVCGLATWRFGLPGLYFGTLGVLAGTLLFVRSRRAVTLRWTLDAAEIRRLIAIGAPIMLAGTIYSLFRSLDKLMILGYFPDREFQLGCYCVALMVSGQLFGLGNMLAMVMAPRLGEKYGQSQNRRDVARLAARATELLAFAMGGVAALAIVAGPPVLARLLPAYRTGLAPLPWLGAGVVALVLALPASQYLVAIDRQRRALIAVTLAMGLAAVGNHVALRSGFGLVGVAAATAIGYAAYFALVLKTSLWIELDRSERMRYVTMLILALGPTLGLAVVLEFLWPAAKSSGSIAAAKAAVVTLSWGFAVAVGWRRGQWREAWRGPQ